jgi:uncharacterized membrane protein (DUF4010 family)
MDLDLVFVKGFSLALALGFMVGLQRELSYHYREKETGFIGARSFTVIALLGYLAAYLDTSTGWVFGVVAALFGLLLIASYCLRTYKGEKSGTTSEFSAIAIFLIGVLAARDELAVAVFVAVVLVVILELRGWLGWVKSRIWQEEVRATIFFLLLIFIVLPLLPNRAVDPYGVFNPYTIWLMVVLISGLSFAGYIAVRLLGPSRGLLATGFFGGFVSSTATTISFAKKAQTDPRLLPHLASGIALACATMFFRIIILTAVIHPPLARMIAPAFLLGTLSGYGYVLLLEWRTRTSSAKIEMAYKNPLELKEALQFGLLFGLVFGLTAWLQNWLGDAGVYLSSVAAGLTDVAAITLSLSKMTESGQLLADIAVIAVILASLANSMVKLGISFAMGGTALGRKVSPAFVLPLLTILLVYGVSRLFF